MIHLSQLKTGGVLCRRGDTIRRVENVTTVLALAQEAVAGGTALADLVGRKGLGEAVDLATLAAEGALACPLTHPDPAHLHLTGTGLTHTGSAATRDAMHKGTELSDSMKMFNLGIEGGKPAPGEIGAQPEWFYKGNGASLAAPGDPLLSPDFALDAGEEPEIAGLYVIGEDGTPWRVGFALGNEFSDHVTEHGNYLWLAHSKLRHASFGPEILVGDLPADLRGTSRILRNGKTVWEKPFLSGETNMSHSIANLEHHHFKYDLFRQPGDVHVHFFGTATLSFADDVQVADGDVFEIEAPEFGLPLRNPLGRADARPTQVRPL